MEDKIIDKLKLKIAISEIKKEKEMAIDKQRKITNKKMGLVACICLVLTTGVVFAKDIDNYIKTIFNNSNKAIDVAVENGYIQQENMEYTYDHGIGIKVDSLILDELNLDIAFNLRIEKENVKSVRLKDFSITNENNKLVFRNNYRYEEGVELPLYNSFSWNNAPIKLEEDTFLDSILLGLRPDRENFGELYFEIKSIDVIYINDTKEVIEGNWNFNIKINEKMKEKANIIYKMQENNEYIEDCIGTMSATGMVIDITTKVKIPCELEKIGKLIHLQNLDNLEYETGFTDWGDNVMRIYFNTIGTFNEKSDTLKLRFDFFDTTVVLHKEVK